MQVPAPFEYERASSVEQAIALLTRHGPESRLIAGGHSLIPMMKLRLATPETLVDINGVDELTGIRVEAEHLRVGAMVRHAELLDSPVVGELFPILRDAEKMIADPPVRNRGTVGGSLCQADPSEDLSAALTALRAVAVIQGDGGRREVPVREFHRGPYETVVDDAEILVEVRLPIRPGGGSAYDKVKRRVGDWAVASVGAALWLSGDPIDREGTVAEVGIGLAALGAAHFDAPEAEEFLRGRPATETTFVEAGRIVAEHCRPPTDQRGPADYKRHLACELTVRALTRAAARARGQEA
jgi:aerobic carbon-monoxide dehydrogenase medium subunit